MSLNFVARTPEGVEVHAQAAGGCSLVEKIQAQRVEYSSDGKVCVRITADSISATTPSGSCTITEPGVVFTSLSSTGAYVVTAQRPSKDESGQGAKNLKVWELSSGACVLALSQKQVNKDSWPAVQWTADDSSAVHMVTNTLHVYSRADAFASPRKVTIKGVSGFAVCPAPPGGSGQQQQLVTAFVPEVKGSPASAGVYDMGVSGNCEPQAVVKKAFYRCQGAKLMWNVTGSACLVLAFADFDVTNQSYYGEQKLYYLPADASKADSACAVPLPKEGPVHDVAWSPLGDYFLAVAGFMPAKVTLFDAACKPIYDLGNGPYNTAAWNPFGRFFAIAGFGNLPGDIIFYDKKTSGTCRQMGAVRAPAVTAQWSPDGRHLLTATVAPRLRVDNSVKVYSYYGELKATMPFATLFEASWQPTPPGTFTDRPQSPERLAASAATSSGGAPTGPVQAAKPSGYVPPHLRGKQGAAAAVSAQFSLAHDPNDNGGRIRAAVSSGGNNVGTLPVREKPLPPGAEFIAPKASKTRKRNAKGKGEGAGGDADGEQGGAADAAAAGVAGLSVSEQQQGQGQGQQEQGQAEDPQKKIRNLQKKLRQIQELKEKAAKEGAGSLVPEQQAKLAAEASILAELKALGGSV